EGLPMRHMLLGQPLERVVVELVVDQRRLGRVELAHRPQGWLRIIRHQSNPTRSMSSGRLFLTLPTSAPTSHASMSAAYGFIIAAACSGVPRIQSSNCPLSSTTGMRLWYWAALGAASVVTMAKLVMASPLAPFHRS